MSNEKPRRSMAEAEKKNATIFLIVAAIVTLLVALSVFIFNTDLKKFSHRAGGFWNVVGAICFVVSFAILYIGKKEEADAKLGIWWFLFLALGVLCSCGFNFDYFGLK